MTPRIFDRYLGRQVLSSTLMGILLLSGVMVLGNVFALVLEGMLVFVQTTRLVLFEFFIRFLRGEGRLFRPVGPASEAERDGNGAQSSPRPRKERA